jgi:cobalamin synthase
VGSASAGERQAASGLDQRWIFILVWLPAFVAAQVVAVAVISAIEPGGFDRCTAAPSPGQQRIQVAVAALSLALPLGIALVWLRGRYLIACVGLLVLPALFWLVLLRPALNC